MRNDIVDILLELGIPAGVKGFTYIHDALELFDTDTYYSSGKICSLYADIALKRGTTPSSVERAIRHAIEVAWGRGKMETIDEVFGYTISTGKGKPTNSEFIALISDKILLEYKKI